MRRAKTDAIPAIAFADMGAIYILCMYIYIYICFFFVCYFLSCSSFPCHSVAWLPMFSLLKQFVGIRSISFCVRNMDIRIIRMLVDLKRLHGALS